MVIYSDRNPREEHVLRYNILQASQISESILDAEDATTARQDNLICQRGELNQNGTYYFLTLRVMHRYYNPFVQAFAPFK